MRRFALVAVLVALASPALAVEPGEALKDPALEARARAISSELRCLVCQNQSIDDSQADLAKDLRLLVRERVSAGDSNEDVKRYLVARYGDFILLKPPFKLDTVLLWGTPFAALAIGALALAMSARRRRNADVEAVELSAEEKKKLSEIISS